MKKLMFLVVVITAMWQLGYAEDNDTLWTRRVVGEDINDVKFSPDGNIIATAHQDNQLKGNAKIHIWNAQTGDELKVIDFHTDFITAIAFTNDGKYLYAAGDNLLGNKIYIKKIELISNQTIKDLSIDESNWSGVRNIFLSKDDTKVFLGLQGSDTSNVLIINNETGELIRNVAVENAMYKFIISSDERYFAFISRYFKSVSHYRVNLWDAVTFEKIKTLDDTKDEITDIAFSSDGTELYEVLNSFEYNMKVLKIPSGDLSKTYKINQVDDIKGIYKLFPFKNSDMIFITYTNKFMQGKNGILDIKNDKLSYIYETSLSDAELIDINTDQTKIICTIGRIYLYLFNNKITGYKDTDSINPINHDIIIPNPLEKKATIKVNIPKAGLTKFALTNETGLDLGILFNDFLDIGYQEVAVNLPSLPNGNYFVSIQGVNFQKTLKLTMIK